MAFVVYEYREKVPVAAFPTEGQANDYASKCREENRAFRYEVQKGSGSEVEE